MKGLMTYPMTQAFLVVIVTMTFENSNAGKKCSYRFSHTDAMRGSFASPNYPNNYPEQMTCSYWFEADKDGGVRVNFKVFSLEESSDSGKQCVFDYIDVYAVDTQGYRTVLGRFCGNDRPAPITSPQSKLLIEFVSDYTKPSTGFYGSFTFLGDNWQPFDHNQQVCGKSDLEGTGGIIQSPNYPHLFPSDVKCSWLIKVKDDEQILLMIEDLDVGISADSRKCNSDDSSSLQLFYGYVTNQTVPNEVLCSDMNSDVITGRERERPSTGSRAVVRFHTGSNNAWKGRGFRLSWTAISFPEEGNCPEFQCDGGTECRMEGLGDICHQLPRYCIHNDQRCNEISNCGFFDDSDERKCTREILFMTALIAVPSVSVLAFLVSVVYFYRYKHIKKSASQNQQLTLSDTPSSSKESFTSHRSNQQCAMHTSFLNGECEETTTLDANHAGTLRNLRGISAHSQKLKGKGDAALRIVNSKSENNININTLSKSTSNENRCELLRNRESMEELLPPPPPPSMMLPEFERQALALDIEDQQLRIPVKVPPDAGYRTCQKRSSYTMLGADFKDSVDVVGEL